MRNRTVVKVLAVFAAIEFAASVADLGHAKAAQGSPKAFVTPEAVKTNIQKHGITLRTILVAPNGLTQAIAEAIARRDLKFVGSSTFGEIIISGTEDDLRRSASGTRPKPEAETSFCETRAQIGDPPRLPTTAAARLIWLRGSAKFSYRDAGAPRTDRAGVQNTLLLGNNDPTEFKSKGATFRLLHLAIKRSSDSEFSGVAFFKADATPSCSACRDLEAQIEAQVGGKDWEIQARRDAWFSSEFFPLVFRFEPDNTPITYKQANGFLSVPTVPEYYRASHVTCNSYYGKFACAGFGKYDGLR